MAGGGKNTVEGHPRMELAEECGACTAIQLVRTLTFRTPDWRRHFPPAMGAALAQYPTADNPGEVLAAMYEAVAAGLGDHDPYRSVKDAANRWAEEWWQTASVPLGDVSALLGLAAQANAIDAGVDTDLGQVFGQFETAAREAPGRDDRPRALDWLTRHPSPRVLYLLDNCGEAVLDRELIRALAAQGAHVTAVVKGGPVLNDVTRREAEAIRLDHWATVVDTKSRRYGLADWHGGGWLEDCALRSDLLIAKGIAMLEAWSHRPLARPILFLYRAKCPPSARLVGVAPHSAVIWWRDPTPRSA